MIARLRRAAPSAAQPLVVISAAILLPSLIYLLVSIGLGYRSERRAIEAATIQRAAVISQDVDAELRVVTATMRALGTIRAIRAEDWDQAKTRSLEIAALQPDWRDVALFDPATGAQLYNSGPDRGAPAMTLSRLRALAQRTTRRPVFTDLVGNADGQPRIMAYLGVPGRSGRLFLLAVAISPDLVQRVLLEHAPRTGVSGVVDGNGLFIARTVAYPQRVGTPGTRYLRGAIRKAKGGLYRGVTWEGLESYTGFATSPATGWSTHVAVSSDLVDAPQRWWMLSSVLAAVISVVLALIFLLLTNRLLRSERLAAERVRQAERLETVGKLTGGVAHDFNNMLAIIRGNLELAERRITRGDANVLSYVRNAMEGVGRAADLTQRLLAFSRRQTLSPVALDTNALIGGMKELLARTLSGAVNVELDLAPGLATVVADRTSLENAIINLAVNARDAMLEGGTLRIETRNVRIGDRDASRFGVPVGDYVRIAVSDTGMGMTPATLARAFEPFFTTKEVGRGTGLGLSQVHGFMLQSGGFVDALSELGRGTTILLHLPAHDGAADGLAGRARTEQPRLGTGEAILLVEDEEALRRTNAEVLRDIGYVVHEAADGPSALASLRAEPSIRLIVSDIVMPGMTGIELARQALAERPDVRILFVTGFERDADDEALERQTLRKPFGADELAHRVGSLLD